MPDCTKVGGVAVFVFRWITLRSPQQHRQKNRDLSAGFREDLVISMFVHRHEHVTLTSWHTFCITQAGRITVPRRRGGISISPDIRNIPYAHCVITPTPTVRRFPRRACVHRHHTLWNRSVGRILLRFSRGNAHMHLIFQPFWLYFSTAYLYIFYTPASESRAVHLHRELVGQWLEHSMCTRAAAAAALSRSTLSSPSLLPTSCTHLYLICTRCRYKRDDALAYMRINLVHTLRFFCVLSLVWMACVGPFGVVGSRV